MRAMMTNDSAAGREFYRKNHANNPGGLEPGGGQPRLEGAIVTLGIKSASAVFRNLFSPARGAT